MAIIKCQAIMLKWELISAWLVLDLVDISYLFHHTVNSKKQSILIHTRFISLFLYFYFYVPPFCTEMNLLVTNSIWVHVCLFFYVDDDHSWENVLQLVLMRFTLRFTCNAMCEILLNILKPEKEPKGNFSRKYILKKINQLLKI